MFNFTIKIFSHELLTYRAAICRHGNVARISYECDNIELLSIINVLLLLSLY